MREGGFLMRKATSVFWGIILVLLGVLLILSQQQLIPRLTWNILWPAAIIVLALLFHFQAFAERLRNPGLLVPGGILLVYGGLFLYCSLAGWRHMEQLWPLFLLGPALGLAELRFFSRGKEGSWIPVIVLTVTGGFFLAQRFTELSAAVVIAALLILIGIGLIIEQFRRSPRSPSDHHNSGE